MTGADIALEARRWIGTPYRHRAARIGVGCDCLGLVIGVRAGLGLATTEPPYYAPDWAEVGGRERLAQACEAILDPVRAGAPDAEPAAGDVLLFRWREGRPASHLAIATGGGTIVHTHVRAAVAEVPLTPSWRRRLAATYRFRETS